MAFVCRGLSTAYRNSGAYGPYAVDGRYPLVLRTSSRDGLGTDLRGAVLRLCLTAANRGDLSLNLRYEGRRHSSKETDHAHRPL